MARAEADFPALKKKYPRFSLEEVRCKFQFLSHVALICQGDAVVSFDLSVTAQEVQGGF